MSTQGAIFSTGGMSGARLFNAYLGDIRFELVKMLRTPAFALPTLVFPAMFYLLFGVWMARGDGGASLNAFARLGVFGTMAPGLFGFGVSLAFEREYGLLTFKQALPMPPGSYLLARMVMAMLFACIISTVMILLAVFAAHAPLTPLAAGKFFLIQALGVLPFCAIGLTVGAFVSGQAAPAIVNVIYLPMAFLAGLWVPFQFLPGTIKQLAGLWPAFHLSQLAFGAIGVETVGSISSHVAALAGVTIVFFSIALRRLSNGGVRMFGGGGAPRAVTAGRVAGRIAFAGGLALLALGAVNGVAPQPQAVAAGSAATSLESSAAQDATPAGIAAPATTVLSAFDAGSTSTAYGEGWLASGDDMRGGDSKASQALIAGGANGSAGALEITGTVGSAIQYPFAGTAFFPVSHEPGAFMDYSRKKSLRFQARGDGHQYTVVFLTGVAVDAIPAMYSFTAGPDWQPVTIDLASLGGADWKRVRGIVVGSMGPAGSFRFAIDDVQLE